MININIMISEFLDSISKQKAMTQTGCTNLISNNVHNLENSHQILEDYGY